MRTQVSSISLLHNTAGSAPCNKAERAEFMLPLMGHAHPDDRVRLGIG
jgi:hypothetical protein